MFKITPRMAQAWRDLPSPRATPADVTLVEGSLGIRLPPAYAAFITQHGFVVFGRDPEGRCVFSYVIDDGVREVTREADITFLFELEKLMRVYRYMISTDFPEDETRPMIPPGYLTIGHDSGQGTLLLDVAANPGRVYYWPESEWRWGTEDNVALGYVAENFEDFINSLRPDLP
ncbi:MAG: SMI1/KNR4 family protein [Betaproteobacteria bacterium]